MKFPFNQEETVLYNTQNRSLLVLSNSLFDGNMIAKDVDYDVLKILRDFQMIGTTDDEILQSMRNKYNNESKTLVITIELTRNCFFECTYCYENGMKNNFKITKNVMDNIIFYIFYIEKIFNKKDVDFLQMNFIGGEPLLAKKELLYLYNRIKILCDTYEVDYRSLINTNGVLLSPSLFSEIQNVDILVSLTNISDHDKNRPFLNGTGSYQKICSALTKCRDAFRRDDVNLIIRFNTNGENFTEFRGFLNELKRLNITISQVDPMYTDEYEQNSFINTLKKQDFLQWNSTTAIDILIEEGFPIVYAPQNYPKPCKAYIRDNCKIFYDGNLGLCDASDFEKRGPNIIDINNGKINLNSYFSRIKEWSPLDDVQCRNCEILLMCGGKYFCKNNKCEVERYDLQSFLKTYIKHTQLGNSDSFVGMQ